MTLPATAQENNMSKLTDLIERMKELGDELDALEEQAKPLQKEYDQLRLELIPGEMAEEDIRSVTGGFGRCTLTSDLYVTVKNKGAMHMWLNDTDNEAMIVPTVNAQTLKAFCKEQLAKAAKIEDPEEAAKVLPPEEVLKVTPFSRAVIYTK